MKSLNKLVAAQKVLNDELYHLERPKEMLEELRVLREEFRVKEDAVRDRYRQQNEEKVNAKRDEIEQVTAQIRKAKAAASEIEGLTAELAGMVRDFHRGTNFGPKGLVPVKCWYSRFILVKIPGHQSWAGLGTMRYAPTSYSLHDMSLLEGMNERSPGRSKYTTTMLMDEEGLKGPKQAIAEAEKIIERIMKAEP